MTDLVILPTHTRSLDALMKFIVVNKSPADFATAIEQALRVSMIETLLYARDPDTAPVPDTFAALHQYFHPHVLASALHYACAQAMRPIATDVQVYVGGEWHRVLDVIPAPWQDAQPHAATPSPAEPAAAPEPALAVTPGVTRPLRLPAPSIAAIPTSPIGRPPLSEFERKRMPRRRYNPPPYWWRGLITMADDVFNQPPSRMAGTPKQVESYGVLIEVLLRAIESAPSEVTAGELSDWLASVRRQIHAAGSGPAVKGLLAALDADE